MAEYTYKDVIIDPEDPRVEIGADYYYGDSPRDVITRANSKDALAYLAELEAADVGCSFYIDDFHHQCIIRKKEPEKKYVPFDLSLEEDRAKLREAWIRPKGRPSVGLKIIAMNIDCVFFYGEKGQSTEDLFMEYEFIDGTPCGKLKEDF